MTKQCPERTRESIDEDIRILRSVIKEIELNYSMANTEWGFNLIKEENESIVKTINYLSNIRWGILGMDNQQPNDSYHIWFSTR